MNLSRIILRIVLPIFVVTLIGVVIAYFVFFREPPMQYADEDFDTRVARPAYAGNGPRVLFDEAHRNIHTTGGLYSPFAKLITNDGYQVVPNKTAFSAASLQGYGVLVIANALGPNESNDAPAFSEAEADAVRDWVEAGGSLLLISDHAPTGAAVEHLAKRFGVEMTKGMAEDLKNYDRETRDTSRIVFSQENGLVVDHPITRGRDAAEKINKVMSFTGQSLKSSQSGAAFLKLADSAVYRPATTKVEKSGSDSRVVITYGDPIMAAGHSQAVALQFGKGRVVILGEAAMLTAQRDGKTSKPFGMNVPGIDNRQLALNIMHWLSGVL